jgi:hypothetical protein
MRNAITVYTRCLTGSQRDASRARALHHVADFVALNSELGCP